MIRNLFVSRFLIVPFIALSSLNIGYAASKLSPEECLLYSLLYTLEPAQLSQYRTQFVDGSSAKMKRLQASVRHQGLEAVTVNKTLLAQHNTHYSNSVPEAKIANQRKSGTCWVFSGCNKLRNYLYGKGKVGKNYDLAENHLYFFSELEKADKWLFDAAKQLRRADLDENDLRSVLSPGDALGDGGLYGYFNFLVARHGLVPQYAMKPTASFKNTEVLRSELNKRLALIAKRMKDTYQGFDVKAGQKSISNEQLVELLKIRKEGVEDVYQILATHLGVPPEKFEVKLSNGKKVMMTPQEYAKKFVGYDPNDYVVVSYNPFLEEKKAYSFPGTGIGVPRAGDVDPNIRVLNVSNKRLQELTQKSLDKGHSVWFGADVTRSVDTKTGIMHPDLYQTDEIYGFKKDEKGSWNSPVDDRYFGTSGMDHAMTIVGYDKPDPSSPILKFKVENSWGDKVGTDGNFHMYREWFEQNVYQIVVPRSILSRSEKNILKEFETLSPDQAQ